jgi:hypothetical protein
VDGRRGGVLLRVGDDRESVGIILCAGGDATVAKLALHALCDWLAGGDVQWLYCVSEENAYYSHDHGFYLTGPAWTSSSLAAARDTPFALSAPTERLDGAELERLAASLEALCREDIEAELSKVPSTWPVTDSELEAVADLSMLVEPPWRRGFGPCCPSINDPSCLSSFPSSDLCPIQRDASSSTSAPWQGAMTRRNGSCGWYRT